MNKQDAVAFLGYCGVAPSAIVATKDWVRAPCPLAPWTHDSGRDTNPSFAIRVNDHGESFFNCFTCESGDCWSLVELLSGFGAAAPKFQLSQATDILMDEGTAKSHVTTKDWGEYCVEEIPVWPEEWLSTFSPAHKIPKAVKYLEGRRVDLTTAGLLDLRYDTSRDAVCFPIRDWLGDLVGMRGRRVDPGDAPPYHMYDYKGYKSSLPWYGEHWADQDRTVVLVESVFDVAAVFPVYDNVMAPLTVGMRPEKVRRAAKFLEVVTLFDNGKGGDKARDKIDKHMTHVNVTHLKPPSHLSDPGDMTKNEIRKVLANYVPVV